MAPNGDRARDDDACPGALRVHQAADGALVRVRLPGGMLTPARLQTLVGLAAGSGSGDLELTSRGSVQIRGIADPGPLAGALTEAGLLPSPTHERVRNIVASPLTGRSGGLADVRGWVRALDEALLADPHLAGLPGRFWFGLDDGRGDVSGLAADVGVQALGDGRVAVLLAGADTGVRAPDSEAVDVLVDLARRFLALRGARWRVAELDDPAALLHGYPTEAAGLQRAVPVAHGPIGWIPQDDGGLVTLGAGVPLGLLPARTAEFLAAVEAPLVVTPWRSVLICDLPEQTADTALRVLAPMGLVFDENSPWLAVSACTGSPGCERSLADVRADAAAAARSGATQRQHFVGCERACGSPRDGRVWVATGGGYRPR